MPSLGVPDNEMARVDQTDETARERIDRLLPALSAAQRRVAVFIAERHLRVGHLSAGEIGRLTGASDATVVRTAQRLGYEGLSELKRAIAAERTGPSLGERLQHSLDVEGGGVVREAVAARVDGLHRLLSTEMLEATHRAATALLAAGRVVLMGVGPSAPVAAYGAVLLGRVGLDTRTIVEGGVGAADGIAGIRPGDAVVVLAYSEVAPHVEALLDHAARSEATVVLLTDHLPAPAGPSVVLRTGRGDPTGAASHVATVAMLEALALVVGEEDPRGSTAALDRINLLRDRIARQLARGRHAQHS